MQLSDVKTHEYKERTLLYIDRVNLKIVWLREGLEVMKYMRLTIRLVTWEMGTWTVYNNHNQRIWGNKREHKSTALLSYDVLKPMNLQGLDDVEMRSVKGQRKNEWRQLFDWSRVVCKEEEWDISGVGLSHPWSIIMPFVEAYYAYMVERSSNNNPCIVPTICIFFFFLK